MEPIILTCPKCGEINTYKNWFDWVLHSPMHWFSKRYTKCQHCGIKSWMKRSEQNDR